MTDRIGWIGEQLKSITLENRRRVLDSRESPPVHGFIQIANQQFLNFSSNDYLGLAADESLVDAVKSVVGQVGWGAGASPLVTGHGIWHRRLEAEIASLKGTESALLFPTGFAANVGVITSLVGQGDLILSDQQNHASIIDGCRLSGAQVQIYRHCDVDHACQFLQDSQQFRRAMIVTDSLFSMDGDFAPLKELAELAQNHRAMLLVDEAHATGVWGLRGSGVCEMLGLEDQIDVRVGTLSKALGSMGGFVAGSQDLIDWILNKARTYMFSTAQPEAISAASLAALKIVESQPERRTRVQELAKKLKRSLNNQGWDTGNSASQIVPIVLGDEKSALELSGKLKERGILVPAIRPPAVPIGKSILRISLSYSHSDEQLAELVKELDRFK